MMKLVAKIKAKNQCSKRHIVSPRDKTAYNKTAYFYLAMKLRSRLLRVKVVGFRFCRKWDVRIKNLQAPIKLKVPSFCEIECSYKRITYKNRGTMHSFSGKSHKDLSTYIADTTVDLFRPPCSHSCQRNDVQHLNFSGVWRK